MDYKIKKSCEKIVMGKMNFKANSLGLGMLLTRLAGKYNLDPKPATLDSCMLEVENFFTKYDSTLGADKSTLQNI